MNGVEDWGLTKVNSFESPQQLTDGSFYQHIRVEGRFRGNFDFGNYPLDKQVLEVVLENSVYSVDELVYISDKQESGFDKDLLIPGWELNQFNVSTLYHTYPTNFGFASDGDRFSKYSAVRIELSVSRPVNYFIWKLLFPLLIVLISSWGALVLDPARVDSRILLPITALLTIVFLQQSYTDALPSLNYLVLIDKLYVLAYILTITAVMETIYTAGIIKKDSMEANERVKKIDRNFLIAKGIFLILGVMSLLIL
jgi:hypothetical protein